MHYFRNNNKPILTLAMLVLSMGFLVGCGGGGDSGNEGGKPPPKEEPKPENIKKSTQTISDFELPEKMKTERVFDLTAFASSKLAVAYQSKTPSICSVANAQITFLNVGVCIIEASQAGNDQYFAAPTISASSTVSVSSSLLTVTGINKCQGQDMAAWIPCVKGKLGSLLGLEQDGEAQDGQAFSFSQKTISSDEECLIDNRTGLVWQQYAKDSNSWRSASKARGSWYDTNPKTNNGNQGYPDGIANQDTQTYITRLNAEKYCGYNDWRMPTASELVGIIDYGKPKGEAKIYSGFYNASATEHWTSSVELADGSAVTVSFAEGTVYFGSKNVPRTIRAVRGVQKQS